MIRARNPEAVWLKQQTSAYRLALRRIVWERSRGGRATRYQATRFNEILNALETGAFTPLRPGEKPH